MSYRLLLHSPIPVVRDGSGWATLDLWAVDLEGQRREVEGLTLLCPVRDVAPADWQGVVPLPADVAVVDVRSLGRRGIDEWVAGCDVVQTYGGQGWRASATCRALVRSARRLGVRSVVGLSSNRARTAILNAVPRSPRAAFTTLRSLVAYIGLRANYRVLTAQADGCFIVGEGLRPLVAKGCPSLHVGVASWIRPDDVAALRGRSSSSVQGPDERLRSVCIASRLERMKGVHVGIEALGLLQASGRADGVTLTVYGAGGERDRLEALASTTGVGPRVRFAGVLGYPSPFLDRLRTHGIVVLPNLNDEQPRLVFDAIVCGCLPLCPDRVAYRALGLPPELLHRAGDAQSLADALERLLRNPALLDGLRARLSDIAERHTLESMHSRRAEWIRREILGAGSSVDVDLLPGHGA